LNYMLSSYINCKISSSIIGLLKSEITVAIFIKSLDTM
jgi:hypothetical protein